MGVYRLNDGYAAAETDAVGGALDGADAVFQELLDEACVLTASGYGLEAYESMLPPRAGVGGIKERRAAVRALAAIDETSFTPKAMSESLSGCGITASVTETDGWYIVSVGYPDTRGVPEKEAELRKRIEAILPCQVDIEYSYIYITWSELESWFGTWDELEASCSTWDELETCSGV